MGNIKIPRRGDSTASSCLALAGNDKEVIVVDNASTDLTAQIVNGFSGKGITLVKRELPKRYSAIYQTKNNECCGTVIREYVNHLQSFFALPSHGIKVIYHKFSRRKTGGRTQ